MSVMANKMNNYQLEKHFKGAANHWRIAILFLVDSRPGVTVTEISAELRGCFKTISEHTRRLVNAGLLIKAYRGRAVVHSLSPYGKTMILFLKIFQHS